MLPNLIRSALAQSPSGQSLSAILAKVKTVGIKPPGAAFALSASGAGVIGPWGEVIVARNGSTVIPAVIRSADKLAVADMTFALHKLGRQAKAGECAQRARELDPTNAKTLLALGISTMDRRATNAAPSDSPRCK